MKYLYGASVQGIQKFIFRTNKLCSIVEASGQVEEICTKLFKDLVPNHQIYGENNTTHGAIQEAAGKIKYLFDSKEDCQKVVRQFPRIVVTSAPGITVSQAVVEFEDESQFTKYDNELEKKLNVQFNRPMRSQTLSLMAIHRDRNTSLPQVEEEAENKENNGSWELCKKAFGEDVKHKNITNNINRFTKDNDWIAIIHADGNGMGQVVQKIANYSNDKGDGKEQVEQESANKPKIFSLFSQNLNKATCEAAKTAYDDLKEQYKFLKDGIIPIRPIVLGGDDFTVVCRADIALDYAESFIRNFKETTKKYLFDDEADEALKKITQNVFTEGNTRNCLTACAGIAYIKSSYPFYYGYNLAEALCNVAKKDAKRAKNVKEGKALPPSCIMFHKVEDSFVEDWQSIVKRELTPQEGIQFDFGPYYTEEVDSDHPGRWTVGDLKTTAEELQQKTDEGKDGNVVKSHLRQWMSLLAENEEKANQKLDRLKEISTSQKSLIELIEKLTTPRPKDSDNVDIRRYPTYDVLTIHTINTQKTKTDKTNKNDK